MEKNAQGLISWLEGLGYKKHAYTRKPQTLEDVYTVVHVPEHLKKGVLETLTMWETIGLELPYKNPTKDMHYVLYKRFNTGTIYYLVNTEGFSYPRYVTLLVI